MRINAGHAVARALRAEGVTHVFGMPGGHVLPIYDGIGLTAGISTILTRHEHHAASMAAGFAQLTGRPGVVLVTAGPGVTNTLTAVAEAFVGCIPMVILGGRGSRMTSHKGASQEVPTDRIFGPVTKWSTRVDRAELLPELVREAFRVARSGRPGPVLLDIPRDVLVEDIEFSGYLPAPQPQRPRADLAIIQRAAAALHGARHPVIVAGGGATASDAGTDITALAEFLRAPVLTSLSGRGVISEHHPLAVGGLGAHRNEVSRRELARADVVLALGTRFEEMETNWQPGAVPPRSAVYIQVDIDAGEFGRSIPVDIPVVGDIRAVVQELRRAVADLGTPASRTSIPELRAAVARLDSWVDELAASTEIPINPVRVIRAARRVFPEDTVLSIDVGALSQHIGGAFPFFRVSRSRSMIVPSSFYGMGFAAAAAPVASLVHPDRPSLCFVGDGSFQMVMNVIPMAAQYGLGVTWCVLNDHALGSIWDLQHHTYGNRILDTTFEYQPDLAMIARGSGAYGETVTDPAGVEGALARAYEANLEGRPAVVDVTVARLRLPQTKQHYFTTYPAEDEFSGPDIDGTRTRDDIASIVPTAPALDSSSSETLEERTNH